MKPNLLATKLHRPSTPANWVQRPYLAQKLNEGLELNRQITLVSAPPGFGKTTCISEWIDTLDWSVAWLSLDSVDDDPGRFFTYLIAALQKVDTNLGQEIEGVLRSGQLPPAEIISTALTNDILASGEQFLLVLDDFHVIQDCFILEVLENLIASQPQELHLVMVTREDPPLPLAQLRASNRLTEIRTKDLRFTKSDIDSFFNEMMGLSLSNKDIGALEDKTEGWVVGLQLAGLSMRERGDTSRFIANLSGSHRFILSYLTEQVLNQQPEEIQHFLLRTSILDKLNGDLCNVVTGRPDSHALLERLFNANLFLIPLDDERQWYRYHHLFADLLRNLQNAYQDNKMAEYHQRASRWYVQAGMASEAIQHALSAKDYEMSVDLLEKHAMEMIMRGFVKTVNGWAQAIPEEWSLQSPRTNLAFAWMYLLRGAFGQAFPYLERLQTIFEKSQPESRAGEKNASVQAEWLALQSLMLYRHGKAKESKNLASKALEILPGQDSRVRSLAYYALASAYWLMEDLANATEAYRLSIQHGRAGKNPMADILSTVSLAGIVLEHGQLHQAFEITSQATDRIERSGLLNPISAAVYAALGDAHYHWHQLEDARRQLLRALHLSTLGGSNSVMLFCHVLLARQYLIEGNPDAATSEIQKAVDLVPLEAPENTLRELVSQQVRIYLANNRPAAAEMALQEHGFSFGDQFRFPDIPTGKGISNSLGFLYNSSLRVLLYQTRTRNDLNSLKPGIELANQLIVTAFESKKLLVALEAFLLRAQIHAEIGDKHASLADYVSALELAEPEGFISVFIEHGQPVAKALVALSKQKQPGSVYSDYIEHILKAFSGPRQMWNGGAAPASSAESRPMTLINPVTDRELEVLCLMAEGLKYKEIAEKMFVTQNTIRFHVKAIYRKLSVNNRTQAIERARQLQIL